MQSGADAPGGASCDFWVGFWAWGKGWAAHTKTHPSCSGYCIWRGLAPAPGVSWSMQERWRVIDHVYGACWHVFLGSSRPLFQVLMSGW